MLKKTKKLIGLSLMLFLSVGCHKPNNEIKNGTEIAKILLANERLDSESLQKDGNIFSKGSEAFAQIKQETIRYSKNTSPISNSFKKEGNLYQWSDAPEYSNFMDYFNSYAINIVGTAERGSALIQLKRTLKYLING